MALRHDESKLRDPRLKALVVLVDDYLYSLSVEDRKQFLQELRNDWCERCGHSEGLSCKEGWCDQVGYMRRESLDQKIHQVFVNDQELDSLKKILRTMDLSDYGSRIVSDARIILERIDR
jgi:hypothetical protein